MTTKELLQQIKRDVEADIDDGELTESDLRHVGSIVKEIIEGAKESLGGEV